MTIDHAFLSLEELDKLLKEDVPYFDLTTFVLGIGQQAGQITFSSRDNIVICGTEEVCRLLQKYNVTVQHSLTSGNLVAPGTTFLEAEGLAQNLHLVWKVCQNILEYTSGIATRTRTLVDLAKDVNPAISVVTTRKVFPGTKALSVKAVLAGGAMPHRLGLSETVLIFPNHLAFLGGLEGFLQLITEIKQKCQEKKICVEVERLEDAKQALKAGVEIIQFDKLDKLELERAVKELKSLDERVQIAAAGGINQANVQAFAATGVDILVTTAPYFGSPADIGVRIQESPKN